MRFLHPLRPLRFRVSCTVLQIIVFIAILIIAVVLTLKGY